MNSNLYEAYYGPNAPNHPFPVKHDIVSIEGGPYTGWNARLMLVLESDGHTNITLGDRLETRPDQQLQLVLDLPPNTEPLDVTLMNMRFRTATHASKWIFGGEVAGKRDWGEELVYERYSLVKRGRLEEPDADAAWKPGDRVRITASVELTVGDQTIKRAWNEQPKVKLECVFDAIVDTCRPGWDSGTYMYVHPDYRSANGHACNDWLPTRNYQSTVSWFWFDGKDSLQLFRPRIGAWTLETAFPRRADVKLKKVK